jgi:hypothetical protein
MSPRISLAISVGAVLIAGIFYAKSADAQGAPPTSLAEQLKAHYKLAKIVPESNSFKIAEPGTMLVIQKEGIVGVSLGSNSVDPVIYAIQKDTDLHHSNAGASTWKFGVGHKVYLSKVDIDAKHEKVLFTIVECDSSNSAKPTYYQSVVDFEFPNGYLAAAEVGQIEDVISQVLTIDNGTNDPQPSVRVGPSLPGCLPNDEIIKLALAKMPDSVVLAKIKSSTCEFDTSTDALIKLKQAGVSDSVLQAMVEAPPPPAPAEAPPSAAPPTQTTFPVRHRHISLAGSGSDAIYYCSGDLSVSADGTVKYDCTQTDDPSGRCDHVSIPAGYLKQAKLGYNSSLHLATKGQGNFDFFGDPSTVKEALAAIQPLTAIVPTASTGTMAPPPNPSASNCGDYESCMKKGEASLEQSEGGAEALTEFEKASQLAPSKGEPLAGKGHAYLQMGQYDNAVYMWDSALKLGATLSSPVCHAGMACGDTGDFLFSMKEVSFINKKGEKKFATAPSAVTSEVGTPPVMFGNGKIAAYYVQLQLSGKNYRFYYSPKALQCRSNFLCSEPGLTQQKVFADYVHNTLDKLKAGGFGSQPNKP